MKPVFMYSAYLKSGFVLAGIASVLLLLSACVPRERVIKEDVVVQVNLSNTLGMNRIYLKELGVRELRVIDSFDVRKTGRHAFRLDPGTAGLYLLQTRPDQVITLLLAPGERVELFADGKKLKTTYQVKGSPGSELLRTYFLDTEKRLHVLDSLRKVFNEVRYRDDFPAMRLSLDSAFYQLYSAQKRYVGQLVRENCHSLASVFILNQRFGPQHIFNEENDFELFTFLDSCLIQVYPDNMHAIDHHERVSKRLRELAEEKLAEERLSAGQPAPGFGLPWMKEREFQLAGTRGKVVLLYFWTATSARARYDHGLMLPFYREQDHTKMEFVSVSLDENPELWKAALKLDRLPWIALNDPRGSRSPLLKLYALDQELPVYYLIDDQGIINFKGQAFTELKPALQQLLP